MIESKHTEHRGAAGTSDRLPPVSTRWRKGQSGNPRGRSKSIDIKTLVQKVNAKKVMVKTPDGKTTRASQGDVVLEQLAHQAIKGDVSAQKTIFKYAKQYLRPPDEGDGDRYLEVERLGESHLDLFKVIGCLSQDCAALEELSLAKINAVYKVFKKVWDDPEQQKQMFEKMYGPPLTDDECY